MMFQSAAKAFTITALVAGACLLQAAPAAAAGTPGDQCASVIAKAMGKCTKKAIGARAGCYKSTGEACTTATDDKLVKALDGAYTSVRDKCGDSAAVIEAGYGYGEYTVLKEIATHFKETCSRQSLVASDRTFGPDGSRYTAADKDGKKCLLRAAKEAGKFMGKQLGNLGKCVAEGCSFDFSVAAGETVAGLDEKCPTLAAMLGTTTTAYIAAATAQIPASLTAPCDPLDASRCMYPFPNDYFTVGGVSTPTGRQLAIGHKSLPRNSAATFVSPTRWNETDGFSIGPMLLVSDPNVDLAMTGAAPITDIAKSLEADAPVVLVDAVTGEKQLLWVERDQQGLTVADQPIIIRVGRNLKEGHRYIAAMRNMKDEAGAIVNASAAFALYRDNTPTTILPVEARRAHMEEMLTTLEGFGVARDDLYLAWDFTTQSSESTSKRLLAIRDDAFDNILGTGAPAFTVATTSVPYGNILRRVDGTFQVPLYLNNNGISGSTLRTDDDGTPLNEGDFFTAKFTCIIPNSAATTPARISLYGHGLLGKETEVDAGNVQDMASEHNMVFCATRWTGFSDDDAVFVASVVTDFSLFPNFIDRQHQGILNMLMLGRLMKHASGFSSDDAFKVGGVSMLDTSDLFYDGNSQGGILGGVLAAFSQDTTRFSLGVPGMNYSTLLNRSVDFTVFDNMLKTDYPQSTDRNLLLSVAQGIWDRTDPNGHILHVLDEPYDNTPVKKVLYQVAFGDHQVAPVTVEVAARSNGASIHQPALSLAKVVPEVTPYYGIPAILAYPFDGSAMVIWDAGNPATPTGNIPPPNILPADPEWAGLSSCAQSATGGDPHSCPRKTMAARAQKSAFLQTGGTIIDVCGGAACLVP